MKKVFSIEEWLKASFQILKINWLEWVFVSVVTTVILSGIFYFSFGQIFTRVLDIIKDQNNWEKSLLEIAGVGAFYLIGMILFLNFLDLFLIHRTSSWYLGTNVSIETNLLKALSSMPMAILLSSAYIIMAFIAFMLCVFPVMRCVTDLRLKNHRLYQKVLYRLLLLIVLAPSAPSLLEDCTLLIFQIIRLTYRLHLM